MIRRLLHIALLVIAVPTFANAQSDTATVMFEVNGLKVILRRNTANDVVAANIYLLGGTQQLTPATQGIEALLLQASERGTKRFPGAATRQLIARLGTQFDIIPQDPARAEYRQGGTLGEKHKHWFRAKFFQQYRLFFRYHVQSKVIVYAWVNDEDTRQAYESDDDAYKVFRRMLERGHPPDDWVRLLSEGQKASSRLQQVAGQSAGKR